MNQQVDIKSLLIGFLGAALLITAFSFKNQDGEGDQHYRTSTTETGVIIIDNRTGEYIMNDYLSPRNWHKGDFQTTHRNSK